MKNKLIKKGLAFLMGITTVATGLCGCNNQNDENRVNDADDLLASVQKSDNAPVYDFNDSTTKPESYDTFINNSSNLAVKMLKSEKYDTENTAIAPLSVSVSLSALANGANQNTLKELKTFLGNNSNSTDTFNQCSSYITQRMSFFNNEESGVFNVNSVWVSDSYSPKRSFLQKYDNFYDSFVYKTDFSKENTNLVMNNLLTDNSNSLIPDGGISIKDDYSLYLDCSMAISDQWLKSYSDDAIKTGDFTTNADSKTSVTYLTSVERSFKTDDAQGFIKDMKDVPCKLICILPNENYSLKDYVNKLTGDKLLDMPYSISATDFAEVSIPEFSISESKSLKNSLTQIGIDDIFSTEADFSKGFADDIFVNDLTQSVQIEINRNGICSSKSESNDKTPTTKVNNNIIFNRPFIYAVIDNESYAPIIIGTVNNPQTSQTE
ncbi:MAG: serpin family protein [Acutalibacteraceae bacterium]|nr:serpin family protein [Acutalibacteraceae bacterium]